MNAINPMCTPYFWCVQTDTNGYALEWPMIARHGAFRYFA